MKAFLSNVATELVSVGSSERYLTNSPSSRRVVTPALGLEADQPVAHHPN
jgi:hypothetical protein